MEIDYISGLKTDEIFGMSKYQSEIHERIANLKLNPIQYPMISKKRLINDAVKYLIYPFIVKSKVRKNHIKHITSQDLAYLLKMINMEKTIVTCFDLIPWVYDNEQLPTSKMKIQGLKKADRIITISEYSKKDIIEYLGYPENKISIVYPAVDHDIYYVKRNREIIKNLGIMDIHKVILYVGSEQPRKNIPFLLEAVSKLKERIPEIRFIKIGNSQVPGAREKHLELVEKLSLQKEVTFVGYVSESDITKYYNAADLFVYPSLYEGFGMPPLEAMACGTPVVTSNVTSLPEVVADAAITVNPKDIDAFVDAMYKMLKDEKLREKMISKGLERAQLFKWERSAEEMRRVYEQLS